MINEERNAFVNLLGTMYGETKKLDHMIVGESKDLKRGSNQIRGTLANVLTPSSTPVPENMLVPGVPLPQHPPVNNPIPAPYYPPTPPSDKLETLLIAINEKLDKIVTFLEKKKKAKKHVSKPRKNVVQEVSNNSVEDQQPVRVDLY